MEFWSFKARNNILVNTYTQEANWRHTGVTVHCHYFKVSHQVELMLTSAAVRVSFASLKYLVWSVLPP